MARIETWLTQDLKEAVKVRYLDGNVFSADNKGNTIGVNVTNNGQPASLSGTVSGSIVRSDGVTVAVSGTLSASKVFISLPQSAYAVPGPISIVIKLTNGNDITTLGAVVANVYRSTTDTVVDPGTIIPSIETLIAAIDAAVASIPADYSSLWTSLAPAYSSSATYAGGQYCTYNGHLYKCITPITSPESWTAAHWTSTNVGAGLYDLMTDVNRREAYSAYETFTPLATGRLTNSGTLSTQQLYGKTTGFFYAWGGERVSLADATGTTIRLMRVARYSSPKEEDFVEIVTGVASYDFVTAGWYRFDVEYRDTTVVATDRIFDDVFFLSTHPGRTFYATDFDGLRIACRDYRFTSIVLVNDISVTAVLHPEHNCTIDGNGFTLEGSQSLRYIFYCVTGNVVTIRNMTMKKAYDDIVFAGLGTTILENCDISYSYENDGVGVHSSGDCIIRNCKIHDCYDEGLSSHDTSWAEVINTEVYKCGYQIGTSTPSGVSFGGLHIGGSRMGTIKDCYCHGNADNGIGFITIDNHYSASAVTICEGNICCDNAVSGIRFGGAANIRCSDNTCFRNGSTGIHFYQKDSHGNNGYIGHNSSFNNTGSDIYVQDGGDAGLVFMDPIS